MGREAGELAYPAGLVFGGDGRDPHRWGRFGYQAGISGWATRLGSPIERRKLDVAFVTFARTELVFWGVKAT